eukprot:scaffold3158_cov389-Prasinococcus_capsulatus_cf.AAC.8
MDGWGRWPVARPEECESVRVSAQVRFSVARHFERPLESGCESSLICRAQRGTGDARAEGPRAV